ncbi:hypothetical protein F1880_000439 [Penicillium rolfsii]|nr:hypothetical protein F1880_000439 [Penicillium rolfsii]
MGSDIEEGEPTELKICLLYQGYGSGPARRDGVLTPLTLLWDYDVATDGAYQVRQLKSYSDPGSILRHAEIIHNLPSLYYISHDES